MCANISASFFCLLIFYFQTPSFWGQSRENTALWQTYIILPGLPWTLPISNKFFLRASWLPQKIFWSKLLSTKANLSIYWFNTICLVQKWDLHHSMPFSLHAQVKQVFNHRMRNKLAAGLQVSWGCRTAANTSSRASGHYFGKKGLAALAKEPDFLEINGEIHLHLSQSRIPSFQLIVSRAFYKQICNPIPKQIHLH